MGKLKSNLANVAKQDTSPAAHRAKVLLRRSILQHIGAEKASVFDAFAGSGHMHDEVWKQAAAYVGCDTRFFFDDRKAFVCDNRRVMRCVDLAQFNIFDLDAYGSPWDQMFILAKRRPLRDGERVGLVLTEGTGMKMKMGGMPRTLARLAGVEMAQAGIADARTQDEIVARAVRRAAGMMKARVRGYWQAAGKVGSRMLYIAVLLETQPGS